MLTTRALLCGSPKVVPSEIGKNPGPCCGFTENVRSFALCVFPDLHNKCSIPQLARARVSLRKPPTFSSSFRFSHLILSSTTSSAIIQDIERNFETEPAHIAYFFFDFKDTGKQDARAFLSSVIVQLSSQSVPLCNILLEFYSSHQHSSQQPSDRELTQCLEKMLKLPIEEPIYFILDALDECPDTSGLQSSRERVL